jgi:uncharacterized protein YdeI (YjbR/CyaY-like superfamily)
MTPTFFDSPAAFRRWLAANHATAAVLWVGFYKKNSGRGGITYPQALDEALCFGWIDGVRKSVDAVSYTVRFTPRTPRSVWSTVNTKRVGELTKLGRMAPAGLKAFEARDRKRSGVYSFEQRVVKLTPDYERQFKANKAAWAFFAVQPPGYRRLASWFVMSAKKDETRQRRLARLIADSAAGRRLTEATGKAKGKGRADGK